MFNKPLFICRHFDINSDLFFNMFTSSRFLIIKAFSLRHKFQLLIKVLPLTRLAIENVIVGRAPLLTNFQQYLDRSEAVRCDLCLKDVL